MIYRYTEEDENHKNKNPTKNKIHIGPEQGLSIFLVKLVNPNQLSVQKKQKLISELHWKEIDLEKKEIEAFRTRGISLDLSSLMVYFFKDFIQVWSVIFLKISSLYSLCPRLKDSVENKRHLQGII